MRMTSARSPECLSRLAVDQLHNGELDDRPEVQAHRATCARCLARIDEHRRERAGFALPRRRPRRWLPGVAAVTAAAAALAVWLAVPRPDTTRSKGKPTIGFYLKRGDVIRRGGPGERVAPGDALDFTASTDAPGYLAIISIDGAHQVSVYYPAGAGAAAIGAGGDQLLPLSVRLDGVLGVERLFGVFCDHPAAVAALTAAVAAGAAPPGCTIDTLMIEKR